MATFSYAAGFGLVPSALLEDSDAVWEALLAEPAEGSKEGSCVRGAQFVAGAQAPTKLNIERCWGALFDLDEGQVPTFDQIEQALEGHRFIAWHTFNSRPGGPRLRLYVPFAVPVWPTEYRFVWHQINAMLGGAADPSQDNPDRLGYLPRIDPERAAEARANYAWTRRQPISQRLNPYTRFGNPTGQQGADGQPLYAFPEGELREMSFSSYDAVDVVPEPDRSNWHDDDTAKEKARAYFRNVGPGIVPGGRHAELFKIGCKLWWDFWLDRDAVAELLAEINQRFPQPKSAFDVHREVEASFARTRGSCAVRQTESDGTEKPPGCKRMRPPRATRGELQQLAQIEKKSTDYTRREVGVWLLRILPKANGHVDQIDAPDARDAAVRRTARFLAEKLPHNEPQDLADLFADTISTCAQAAPWSMTTDQIRTIIETAQREAEERRVQQQQAEDAARAHRIRIATQRARNTEYSEAEVQSFADAHGASLAQWRNQWVIVLGRNHYIFVNGRYKYPVDGENFVNRALVDLSPVPNASLYRFNRQGEPVLMTRQQIIESYGTVAHRGLVDLTSQHSYYSLSTETFVEAPCPLRKDIEPERIPVVEDWLATFPDASIIDYLSYITNLDEVLPALYLCGRRKSGKTLLAHALSRLWRKDRSLVPLDAYFEGFNEQILDSPLLVADEVLPKQLTTPQGSELFRQLIVAQSRPLNRKFLKSMSVTGHFRVLLLSNNDRMLPRGTGFMTEHDSDAIGERILYMDLNDGPAAFLARLSRKQRDAFIEQDLVAKHALWLRDNRRPRGEDRMAVPGTSSSVTKRIDYEGARGLVLHWIYNVVLEEGGFSPVEAKDMPIFVNTDDGSIHVGVNMNEVKGSWREVLIEDRTPQNAELRDALTTVSLARQRTRTHAKGGKQLRYTIVDTGYILKYAEWCLLDAEAFAGKLSLLAAKARDEDRLYAFSPSQEDGG